MERMITYTGLDQLRRDGSDNVRRLPITTLNSLMQSPFWSTAMTENEPISTTAASRQGRCQPIRETAISSTGSCICMPRTGVAACFKIDVDLRRMGTFEARVAVSTTVVSLG
jgi:hypothetical protein